jgi:hypothetical protein
MRSIFLTTAMALATVAASITVASAAWTASMSGSVVDVKSLEPVSDATVRIYAESGSQVMGMATTDARGAFVISGLKGGEYRLQFQKTGYQRTVVAGIFVRPGERMIEAAPIAMYRNGVPLPNFAMSQPCGSLIQPGQTADVYIVCSE